METPCCWLIRLLCGLVGAESQAIVELGELVVKLRSGEALDRAYNQLVEAKLLVRLRCPLILIHYYVY